MGKQQLLALNELQNGGVIAYPTDTTYGIGCDITNTEAVKKIYEMKGRDFSKPLSIACSSLEMIQQYANIDDIPSDFLSKIFPGPVTLLLTKYDSVIDIITAGGSKVGVRIPDYPEILEIIEVLGHPIITTSANLSGQPDAISSDQIKVKVDFILPGDCHFKQPSTIIDTIDKKIVRAGVNAKYYRVLIEKYL